MRVLVTGAAGKLGSSVCRAVRAAGFDLVATDLQHPVGFEHDLVRGDLRDEAFVSQLVQSVEAVVHLGNHPNAFAGPSPQSLLSDNTRMNANVIYQSARAGVRRLVVSSSIQCTLHTNFDSEPARRPPRRLPYLPLDENLPFAPGPNPYALSKEFGERLLQQTSQASPELSSIALRFPMLVADDRVATFERPRTAAALLRLNFCECLAHLTLSDAAAVVVAALSRGRTGHHVYFPALAMRLGDLSAAEVALRYFPETPLRAGTGELSTLIDLTRIEAELGWKPTRCIHIPLED